MATQRWEYHWHRVEVHMVDHQQTNDPLAAEERAIVSQLGDDGWELVSVVLTPGSGTPIENESYAVAILYVFKRSNG